MRGLSDQSRRTEGQVSRSSRAMSNSLISVRSIARTLAPALAGLGAVQQIRSTISTFADFEQSMAQVAAITRATSEEMGRMNEIAKQLGATTEFTASQAASGLRFLGQAGFSAAESIQALPDVLNLATAAALDLGRAADITSNIMGAFGISAANAHEAADVLALASSRSNTNVEQLGSAMAMAGPVANALGVDIGATAAAIGALSDLGIQGSQAGTGLRRVLSSLANATPAATRALAGMGLTLDKLNPQTNDLVDIVDRLAEANSGASEAFTIFGDRGAPAILALVENNDKLRELTEELGSAEGAARIMAETMRDTLTGDLNSLRSVIEGIRITIGEAFSESIRARVQATIARFQELNSLLASGQIAYYVEAIGVSFAETAADIEHALHWARTEITEFTDFVGVESGEVSDFLVGAFVNFAPNVRAAIQLATVELAVMVERARAAGQTIAIAVDPRNWFGGDSPANFWEQEQARISQVRRDSIAQILQERDATLQARDEVIERGEIVRRQWEREREEIEQTSAVVQSFTEAVTSAGREGSDAAQEIVDSLQDQYRQMVLTERQYTAVRLAAAGASSAQVQAAMDALDAIEALNKEADETLDWADRLSAISDGFGSIRDTMDSGSDAAERLGIAMQALAVAQGIAAVVNQGTGDPYTAFARMAAMAAAVASLGIQINSLGGSGPSVSERRQQTQGTGTVFGDAEAKSESILKATEITADATQQLVGINRGMLNALHMMQSGIDSVSSGLARQEFGRDSELLSGMAFGYSAVHSRNIFNSGSAAYIRLLQDQGIELIGGSFAAIIDGSIAFAQEYAEVPEQWKHHGVTIRERVNTYTQELSQEVNEGILSVFVGMADSVSAAAEILGVSSSEIERRFREFNVAAQLISLTDLDADERQDEIAAVFSSFFDNLAAAVVPYVEEFAQIGEGYAETLTRIATEVQVAEHAVEMLGLRFSKLSGRHLVEASSRLIELGGGLDEFISNMQSFTGRFASEAEQFRLNAQNLQRGLEGLPLPSTRDGFWQLMQAQDAATEAGARNIATLLRLQGIADQYYNHLESQQRDLERVTDASLSELRRIVDRDMDRVREAYQSAQQAIQDEAQERLAANRAAISAAQALAAGIESELNSVGRALSSLIGGTISQETRRQSAVQRLVRAVSVGDFTGAGDAAQIAAGINADSFESASDFRVEQARTIALLTRVQRGADQQLSEAQLQLQSIEAQTSVIEASRDAQQIGRAAWRD